MKHYNIQNYIRYKNDLEVTIARIPKKEFHEYTRDELVITFLPLVENLARKFATSQQASGVMSIMDIIQEGNAGLTRAVDRIVWETILDAEDQEKRLNKSDRNAILVLEMRVGAGAQQHLHRDKLPRIWVGPYLGFIA